MNLTGEWGIARDELMSDEAVAQYEEHRVAGAIACITGSCVASVAQVVVALRTLVIRRMMNTRT